MSYCLGQIFLDLVVKCPFELVALLSIMRPMRNIYKLAVMYAGAVVQSEVIHAASAVYLNQRFDWHCPLVHFAKFAGINLLLYVAPLVFVVRLSRRAKHLYNVELDPSAGNHTSIYSPCI